MIIRLIGAVLLEANDEWQLQHRYMQTEAMAELTPSMPAAVPTQIGIPLPSSVRTHKEFQAWFRANSTAATGALR